MLLRNNSMLNKSSQKKLFSNYSGFVFTIIFVAITVTSCVSSKIPNYTFNQKNAATPLQDDVVLLKKILEANHPSLYWYTSKDSLDYYFNNAIANIKDSLTESQFRNTIASVISKIRCGHTSVRFSKSYSNLLEKNRYPQFPLYFKVWNDSLIVLLNSLPKDTLLTRGTIVTSINGNTNRALLDKMFDVISTDGYSNNYKNQVVSSNFPGWYKSVYGLDSQYVIKYIDKLGNEATTIIKNFTPIKDTTLKKDTTNKTIASVILRPTRKQIRDGKLLAKRSMQIDTNINTAYIRLATFSGGKLNKFLKKSFAIIKKKKVENIIIDLRENGGGSVSNSTILSQYLINKSFKNGDTVAAIARTFPYRKHISEWWLYWIPMNFFAHKNNDGRIHYRRFENHFYKPKQKNHFNGNVFLIQGGVTFSASTMFIGLLKGQSNVTIVGEETGGGFYGNTAMHLPIIILPNSKLRVVLPMYRLVINKDRIKNGRGILPDVYVPPSSIAIKNGVDIKLQRIREIIINKKKTLVIN